MAKLIGTVLKHDKPSILQSDNATQLTLNLTQKIFMLFLFLHLSSTANHLETTGPVDGQKRARLFLPSGYSSRRMKEGSLFLDDAIGT